MAKSRTFGQRERGFRLSQHASMRSILHCLTRPTDEYVEPPFNFVPSSRSVALIFVTSGVTTTDLSLQLTL